MRLFNLIKMMTGPVTGHPQSTASAGRPAGAHWWAPDPCHPSSFFLLFFVALFVVSRGGWAGQVSPEQGSFQEGIREFDIKGPGFDLALDRVYNSMDTQEGLLGYGWRTNIQQKFEILSSGNIRIWDGHGFGTVFTPENIPQKERTKFYDSIFSRIPKSEQTQSIKAQLEKDNTFLQKKIIEIVALDLSKKFPTAKQAQMRQELIKSELLRERWAQAHNYKVFSYPIETSFASHDRGAESLQYTHFKMQKGNQTISMSGYVRKFIMTGKTQFYDIQGRLLRETDVAGNYLSYEYIEDPQRLFQVSAIKNKVGQYIKLKYNNQGLLASVESSTGQKRWYEYDDKKNLVHAKNEKNDESFYEYDKNHNLSHLKDINVSPVVQSPFKKEEESKKETHEEFISYYPTNRIKTYRASENAFETQYAYWPEKDLGKAMHTKTTVKRVYKLKDKPMSTEIVKYERWYGMRANNTRFVQKVRVERGDFVEETELSECCGQPLKIAQMVKDPTGRTPTSIRQKTFKYDNKSRITEVIEPSGEVIQYSYYEKDLAHKIKEVIRGNLKLEFEYSSKGDLKKASRTEKLGDLTQKVAVLIHYDDRGRIDQFIDQDEKGKSKTVSFKHDAAGNPIEVTVKNLGTIYLKYDKFGKIN
ncbi:MAG: hypothetical protein HYS98_02125, partial [Deltaproteobacteria bacterium]|nr:hypothetical protein [Deltaproteobacteria bacterium]